MGVELHYYWLIASSNKILFTNIRGSMTAQNKRGWLVGNKSYLNTFPSGTTIIIGVMTLGCLALWIHRPEADKLLVVKKRCQMLLIIHDAKLSDSSNVWVIKEAFIQWEWSKVFTHLGEL